MNDLRDKEKHALDKDGILKDGVSHYPADAHDLESYADASRALTELKVPKLMDSDNPHDRMFIAAFDGTGNDAKNDPNHASNVSKIADDINKSNERTGINETSVGYVEGPGTQKNPITRLFDQASGHTYGERLETMYDRLVAQVADWKAEDPDAQIRLANIGFSRGAEQAAGFARLVHERGIVDPDSRVTKVDARGNQIVEYTRYLVPPGQTPQAVGLFDPVGTGDPVNKHDRRLPPSVVSGFQIISEDERRNQFKSSHIIDPGLSEDGRFLGVYVGGAHSDVGGTYHRNGLGIRSANVMSDYLNSLSDTDYLKKSHEPDDPRLNVVHRSEQGNLLFRIDKKVDRREEEGYVERLVPKKEMDKVADPYNSEPMDPQWKGKFELNNGRIGPVPPAGVSSESMQHDSLSQHSKTQTDREAAFDRITNAAMHGDINTITAAGRQYAQTAAGQEWLQQGREHNERIRELTQQEAQSAQQALLAQQHSNEQPRGPVMRP